MRLLLAGLATTAILLAGCLVQREEPLESSRLALAGELPCAPRDVLVRVCQQCHTAPPQNGAPLSLVTYDDVTRTIDGRPVAEWMRRAIEADRMPLPPATLSAADRETLLAWLRDGAPPAPVGTSCP